MLTLGHSCLRGLCSCDPVKDLEVGGDPGLSGEQRRLQGPQKSQEDGVDGDVRRRQGQLGRRQAASPRRGVGAGVGPGPRRAVARGLEDARTRLLPWSFRKERGCCLFRLLSPGQDVGHGSELFGGHQAWDDGCSIGEQPLQPLASVLRPGYPSHTPNTAGPSSGVRAAFLVSAPRPSRPFSLG